ncbi:MAG: methyltransferase domain-containing protein [Nitrospinaceae bacterium]|nr:class I SAM-dependent methyltransferase [Nitrospinaceae bacterium]NIR55751.1 class I SAM-dependent methyltransferase [Nitrospinaceae bacterium]NIT83030.1 class I SAM-dependent methyltransferase [Nitrospinaceae bacterium]NIU97406.1 methyltransferase domain-containing protein [Nitrospinaceae bacterium]NIW06821.1 methyltransferase domain-containing protein [Nitrospinaceae bacterium]
MLNKLKIDTKEFQSHSGEQYKEKTIQNWSADPCGSNYSEKAFLSREYFDEIEKHRYETHPWILKAIQSFDLTGKNVLEIGCGMGTDHLSLARRGGVMHGIDLIPKNIEITRERFRLFDKETRLTQGDAENLPYPDNSMDFVYSFGVLHHSPDTEKTINEIHRVLKPGGQCYVTVYHKHSIFFWWTTFLWNFILRGGWRQRTLQEQLSLIEYPNHNPDLVTRLYRKKEFKNYFKPFSRVNASIQHLIPADMAHLDSLFRNPLKPTPALNRLGQWFGWYIAIRAIN